MIDLRLYRYALLAVPLAAVIAMFSLQSVATPLSGGVPPDAFDPAVAAPLAKQIAESSAYPTPGSAADNKMAEQVKQQFSEIDGATVSEQRFGGSFHGNDVDLRNLIATLPGESDRQIALIAPRDVAQGSGAVTTAAATAAMLQIADTFSGSSHHKTLVFVSTDGSSIGALGAKRFIRDYSDAGLLDAAIVLSQPAVQEPTAPLVIPWSSGPQSTASQLDETAVSIVSKEAATPAGDEGPLDDLYRLALPAGLGEQGPLVEAGLPAVRLSSDGELPLDAGQDIPDNFNTDTFSRFGRASLALILALDASPGAVQHGPSGYIGLAGNLLPGWTIAMLALALLFPVALAAGAGLAVAARSPIEAARGFFWAGLRIGPFLGALIILLVAAVVGLLPSPDFPFDPREESLGLGGAISVAVAVLAYCAIAFFLRPLRPPPPEASRGAAPAAVLLACVATLGVWAVNPYMGLLVAIGLQAWLFAATRPGGRPTVVGLVLLGLVPLVLLVANLAGRFDAGIEVWHDPLLLLADGQIGTSLALMGCVLGGAGVAIVALGGSPDRPSSELEVDGEKISVRRQAPSREAELEPPEEELPEESGPGEAEPPPEPAQPEPERDPRLWSKPRGWISPPPGSRRATPSPSTT
jgi:hypothetical protein